MAYRQLRTLPPWHNVDLRASCMRVGLIGENDAEALLGQSFLVQQDASAP